MKISLLQRYAAVSFLVITAVRPAHAADANLYLIEKSRWYTQTSANSMVPATHSPGIFGDAVEGSYEFFGLVTRISQGAVANASVILPAGSPAYGMVPRGLTSLIFWRDFASQSALDAAFPNGAYKVSMTTADDGAQKPTLSLTGDAYPNIPSFVNFDAAQTIATTADFRLVWTPFVGATSDDAVSFRIFDDMDRLVFSTPAGGPGTLASNSTGGIIPANTLMPGHSYHIELLFFKVVQFNFAEYPGSLGIAEYDSVITLSLRTRSRLSTTTTPNGNSLTFQADGTMGKQYDIQVAASLTSGDWTSLKTVTASSDTFDIVVPMDTEVPGRFFRLLEK